MTPAELRQTANDVLAAGPCQSVHRSPNRAVTTPCALALGHDGYHRGLGKVWGEDGVLIREVG